VTNKVDAAAITNFVYQYDPNGRPTNRTDALSRQTQYPYDAVGKRAEMLRTFLSSYFSPNWRRRVFVGWAELKS